MSSPPPISATPIFPGEVFVQAADFDAGIRQLLPRYEELLTTIVRCLPPHATRILELGCGTGELSQPVLHHCPQATLVAVDYSPRMLAQAQLKLDAAGLGGRVTWVQADFGAWAEDQSVTGIEGEFDACISSLAIHHLEDGTKQKLLQRIYQSLKVGGCFWNGDPTLPASEAMAEVYEAVRSDWVASQGDLDRWQAKRGTSLPEGYSGPDRLMTLTAHLQMLAMAGFSAVEVPWKYYNLAVFGGFRET